MGCFISRKKDKVAVVFKRVVEIEMIDKTVVLEVVR